MVISKCGLCDFLPYQSCHVRLLHAAKLVTCAWRMDLFCPRGLKPIQTQKALKKKGYSPPLSQPAPSAWVESQPSIFKTDVIPLIHVSPQRPTSGHNPCALRLFYTPFKATYRICLTTPQLAHSFQPWLFPLCVALQGKPLFDRGDGNRV